jgi:hypothetical protein
VLEQFVQAIPQIGVIQPPFVREDRHRQCPGLRSSLMSAPPPVANLGIKEILQI